MKIRKKINFEYLFLFFFLYLTLLIGFYFNEDASGSGGFRADFYNTWGYVIALQDKIFEFPGQWTDNTPLHYLIISKLNFKYNSKSNKESRIIVSV